VLAPQAPPPAPSARDNYPALVVFKAGGMYSATKYWVKSQHLYFVTTQGETLYAPLAMIDHVYPGSVNFHRPSSPSNPTY
jgi:hypothetical protein